MAAYAPAGAYLFLGSVSNFAPVSSVESDFVVKKVFYTISGCKPYIVIVGPYYFEHWREFMPWAVAVTCILKEQAVLE